MTRHELGRAARATAAVAAVYTAFLLCAQFGFLAQLEERLGRDARFLHFVLAAMLAGGAAGSVLAARRLAAGDPARVVRLGLAATALATAVSPLAAGVLTLTLTAAALGGALGFATVALAGALPRLAPRARWGSVAGVGTGLAYAISNLPPLFAGPSALRAIVPAAIAAAAALWPPRSGDALDTIVPESPLRFAGLIAAFGALVALDSAAFAHVQRSGELLAATWGGSVLQWRQGAIHLAAAIAAGVLLDRGRLRATVLLAAGVFAFALPSLGDASLRAAAGVLYPVGISLYSAALVAAPALSGGWAAAPVRAAWLYALAGWLGSALGVGAAEARDFRGVALLGFALFALFTCVELARRRALIAALGPAGAGGLVVGALLVSLPADGARGQPAADPVAHGRAVYLAEGCQHCHSQYVRPVSHDLLWWGPRRELDRAERPPTPGTRRVGPDLANAGLRRSAWWHETHLRDPRSVSPGSRMPSYAHLFDDDRGADLVAYLGSLGAGSEAERDAAIARWKPPETPGDATRGERLFARHCAPCHGSGGRGDGFVARAIARPTLDLTKRPLFRVAPLGGESLDDALARAIRFGLPPGSMPGHEWLSDTEVADLVAFVGVLAARGARSGAA